MTFPARALRLALPAAIVAVAAGCAAPAGSTGSGRPAVVASTSVYGVIAAEIAGDAAEVTSIITQQNQDPHGYEASARDQLALARADLVIQNGGGYDPFVAELLETTGTEPVLLTAVEDGEEAAHDSAEERDHAENEHVWYSLHAMETLAGRIGSALADLDPERADDYAANAERFATGIVELEQRIEAVRARSEGTAALATEPVPLPLLAELGIEDRTPKEFLAAIEDERDVPPAVLAEARDLLRAGDVGLLAFNKQTVDATGTRLLDQARASGVPVVAFSELPPDGVGYLEWMDGNLDRVEQALG